MAKLQQPIVLQSLGDLVERGYGLTAHCDACAHFVRLDITAIAARVGRSWPYMRKLPLRCSACGSTAVKTLLATPGSGPIGASSNA